MFIDDSARMYVAQALERLGVICPERYLVMLGKTPSDRAIENLSPWVFLPMPERSVGYCSEAFGQPVLPFAQAAGQDLVACFLARPLTSPSVIVINPWSDDKSDVVKAELSDYSAWLIYADQISREVLEREREEDED